MKVVQKLETSVLIDTMNKAIKASQGVNLDENHEELEPDLISAKKFKPLLLTMKVCKEMAEAATVTSILKELDKKDND